ncbi:MAG: TetR/AcrR family transcriptional regulator [Candidatus Limnocylindria bacterium]
MRPPAADPAASTPPAASTGGASTTRAREPLSRERIVCAAAEFIDRNCLADLSMRKLGSDLGVEAMSLYRYFPSKAELLDAVAEQIVKDLRLPDRDGDWRERVRDFARSFRAAGRAHPRAFPLLAAAPAGHPSLSRTSAALRDRLKEAGFDAETVAHAETAVMGYVVGSTLWVLREGASDDASAGAAGPRDDEFEFGLDLLLAGLESRLTVASGRT